MDETEGVKGEFKDNDLRECAHFFGRKPLKKLIKNNPGLLSVFRAHQVKENGYEMHKFGKSNAFPTCITVFSAPNYCGSYGNRGAIIILKENNLKLQTYTQDEGNFRLLDGHNLFSWSMPFLADKVTTMLLYIVN